MQVTCLLSRLQVRVACARKFDIIEVVKMKTARIFSNISSKSQCWETNTRSLKLSGWRHCEWMLRIKWYQNWIWQISCIMLKLNNNVLLEEQGHQRLDHDLRLLTLCIAETANRMFCMLNIIRSQPVVCFFYQHFLYTPVYALTWVLLGMHWCSMTFFEETESI